MSFITYCTLSLVIIFLALYHTERINREKKLERRMHGLNVLQTGLELMTAIQQHRGMSAALLNGDHSFKLRLATKRSEIESLSLRIDQLIGATPELMTDRKRLGEIKKRWDSLSHKLESLTSEQSFGEHTMLVRLVIHLMGDMGEHLGLIDGEGSQLAILSNALLLQLPLLLESIGQARALGSGYAAQGKCGAVGRIRLAFLEQRIRECRKTINTQNNTGSTASAKVDRLLLTLEEKFVRADLVDISPDTFFRTATDAIDACLMLWKDVANSTGKAITESR